MEIKVSIFAVLVLVLLVLCYYDSDIEYTGKNKRLICEGYDPVLSPDGLKVLFMDLDYNQGSYYMINTDGTNKIEVSNGSMSRPSISPDNTEILYHGRSINRSATGYWGEFNLEIRIRDIGGTNDRLIAEGYYASFSSDGNRVVFASIEKNDSDELWQWNNSLRIVDKDGTNETILMETHFPYYILHPMFFQNGQRILFCLDNTAKPIERRGYNDSIYEENGFITAGVWTIDTNGTNLQHLADDGAAKGFRSGARISRNMGKIIRYGNTHYHHNTLWTMNVDGTNEVQIMKPSYLDSADISIDGKKIVWYWFHETEDFFGEITSKDEIWISNSDGTGKERLVRGTHPQFSPIGKKIIYENEGKIYSIEYD